MRITLLCSDPAHPVNAYLEKWMALNCHQHEIVLVRRKSQLPGGDLLFLISCSEIMHDKDRSAYRASLVLHASDLPCGRGWSPHVWALVDGADEITLSLLEAEDKVDSGRIWKKITVPVPRHALWDEINNYLFTAEIELIDYAVREFNNVRPKIQPADIEPTYYRRRVPEDSRINPGMSLESQFDLIRVCDPNRFPAFFDLHGHRYKLILEKMNEQTDQD